MAQMPPAFPPVLEPAPTDELRIGVATMQPGEIFFERFGHNAIVVDDPALGQPMSYNFGFFDPNEPGFIRRFIRGQMQYRLVELPLARDMAYYRHVGRGVSIQWLDLTPAQARDMADTLAENARPENARYSYDYFTDNCSTRVRDAIDQALGGLLHNRLAASSRGNTYRSEALRLASPDHLMWLGFDLGFGPFADRSLSLWQSAFVPMRLADSLREVTLADGRPLVRSESVLLPHRLAPAPAATARPWWPYALAGIALALGILALGRRRPRWLATIALPFWTLCGLLGLLMLFIWCCTAHRAGWSNHNLLLLSPLCLLLLPGGWRIARGRDAGTWFRRWLLVIVVGAGFALFVHMLFANQANASWIVLLLPVHAALWFVWRPLPAPM